MSHQNLINNLRALLPAASQPGLAPAEPRGARPGKRVSVPYTPPPSTGGIASPLTEQTRIEEGETVPDRDYYTDAEVVTSSTDGLISFVIKPIRTTRFTDANSALEVRKYAQPG